AIDLFAQLVGTPDAGGAWSGPSAVVGGLFDPATMAAGVYTYTISVPPPCVDATSTVTVDVVAPPNPGADGSLTLCISSPAASLFDALGGTPDAGGTWSGPSAVVGGLFDPATMIAGDYTYTVNGNSPCPAASAVVSVSVVAAPDAGTDDILNLCASGDPVDLFQVLGGADPGGSWAGPSGAFSGTFLPGSSPAGDYTYTVAGMPPCPMDAAVITVTVVELADAGQDGAIALCSSAGTTNLFNNLQGTPQSGGNWLSPSGSSFGDSFDPGVDQPGTYLYVVTVPLPCVNDTAQVVVSVTQAANAGTDSSYTFCNSDATVSLMTLLGGTPDEAGTWSGPNGPVGLAFHPNYDPAGTYTYTVPGTAPCADATASVVISLNPMPDAGQDGTLTLCPEADAADLFSTLGGAPDAGGSWTAPNGLAHSGSFDPAVDPAGAYTYTVLGTAPCPNDQSQSTVTLYVVPIPNAGPDSVSCTLSGMVNATGTWNTGQWSGGPGTVISAPDSSHTSVSAHTAGAYTFTWNTLSAEGCANADSVTIIFTDSIIPTVEVTGTLCHGSCDGNFLATVTGGNAGSATDYTYQLSGGTGGPMPVNAGYCAGDYVLTVLDTNGCAASVAFTIPEPEPLVIDQLIPTETLCPNSCDGTIQVSDPEGLQYSLGNAAPQSSSLFTGLCPGTYTLTMWNANGCSATGTALIGSPEPVLANFSMHPDSVFVNDPVITFTNASSANAASFLWNFGDGTSSTELSPEHAFPMGVAADYQVCLTAYSINGCPDTYCTPLPVLDLPAIFVPNAFTPDGDGRNDVFQVLGTGLSPKDFHLMIFDRWGELIYDTTDLGAAWDGTRDGAAVKSDVYVWSVKAYSRYSIEPYEMQGHVTLLR
ncbi:MAG: gliding motility-associated C-terminal domain-containing protein, partial [Bacteroidetes bacterium]|nr:gliding motility-associated C-terminal domain-containing protein [Bacteroidota bacterium]